jgi:hypothetical protein
MGCVLQSEQACPLTCATTVASSSSSWDTRPCRSGAMARFLCDRAHAAPLRDMLVLGEMQMLPM